MAIFVNNRKLCVAIIDDGVNDNLINARTYSYYINDNAVIKDNEKPNIQSHGTICAQIIEKYCKDSICFISIRFLGENGNGALSDLICALEWCASKKIEVINISNGVTDYSLDQLVLLKEACDKLIKKKVIIVAAQSNYYRNTFPASFPNVISVEQIEFKRSNQLMKSNIYCAGNHKIKSRSGHILTEKCNSLACDYAIANKNKKKIGKRMMFRGYHSYRVTDDSIKWLDNTLRVTDMIEHGINGKGKKNLSVIVKDKHELNYIKKLPECISTVIFKKRITVRTKLWLSLHKIFYWDYYGYAFESQGSCIDLPPLIKWKFNNLNETDLIKRIEMQFNDKLYSSAIVSTHDDAIVNGWFYAKKEHINRVLLAVNDYIKPDVFLLITDSELPGVIIDLKIEKIASDWVLTYENKKRIVSEDDIFENIVVAFLKYGE